MNAYCIVHTIVWQIIPKFNCIAITYYRESVCKNQPDNHTIIAITVCNFAFNITDNAILHKKIYFSIHPS